MFQCQPTTDQSGRVFTPNIPDLYFNHANAAAFRIGAKANLTTVTRLSRTIFIYTTPPESACSGIVTAIQYCYHAKININITMPKLSFLRFLSLSRDGFDFTVSEKSTGEANGVCSDYPGSDGQRVCCGKKNLATNNRQFRIPSNYTFGVILLRNDIQPLAFSGTADMKYQFPHFVRRLSTSSPTSLTLNENDYQSDRYLLLMRLLLGINNSLNDRKAMYNYIKISDPDEPVTTDLVTTDPVITDPVITDPVITDPVTTDSVTTDPVTTDFVTTDPVTTDPVTTKPISEATASESPPKTSSTSILGAETSDSTSTSGAGSGGAVTIAGGIVGGVVVTILLLLVVALVAFMWRKRQKTGNINILTMSNATYDGNNIVIMSHVMSMFTCRSKPHWVTEWMWRSVCWCWSSSGAQYVHERTTCAGTYGSYTYKCHSISGMHVGA